MNLTDWLFCVENIKDTIVDKLQVSTLTYVRSTTLTFYKIILYISSTYQANEFDKLCSSNDLQLQNHSDDVISDENYELNIGNDWNLCEYSTLLVELGKQQEQVSWSKNHWTAGQKRVTAERTRPYVVQSLAE